MNFCRDCAWMQMKPGLPVEYALCTNPQIATYNPVSGALGTFCKSERMDLSINKCGKDGKLFEPFKIVEVEVLP